MSDILNEDFIQKKVKSKEKNTVTENLEDIYGIDATSIVINTMTQTGLHPVPTTNDAYIVNITQDGKQFAVANDKFVILTKNYMTDMISSMARMERTIKNQQRDIFDLRSKLESGKSSLQNQVNSLNNRLGKAGHGYGDDE